MLQSWLLLLRQQLFQALPTGWAAGWADVSAKGEDPAQGEAAGQVDLEQHLGTGLSHAARRPEGTPLPNPRPPPVSKSLVSTQQALCLREPERAVLFPAPGAQSRLCIREKLFPAGREEWPPGGNCCPGGLRRPLSPASSLISTRPSAPRQPPVLRPALHRPPNCTLSASGPTNIFGVRQAWIPTGVWTLPSCVTLGTCRCLSDLIFTQYDTIFEYSLIAGPKALGTLLGTWRMLRRQELSGLFLPSPPLLHPHRPPFSPWASSL